MQVIKSTVQSLLPGRISVYFIAVSGHPVTSKNELNIQATETLTGLNVVSVIYFVFVPSTQQQKFFRKTVTGIFYLKNCVQVTGSSKKKTHQLITMAFHIFLFCLFSIKVRMQQTKLVCKVRHLSPYFLLLGPSILNHTFNPLIFCTLVNNFLIMKRNRAGLKRGIQYFISPLKSNRFGWIHNNHPFFPTEYLCKILERFYIKLAFFLRAHFFKLCITFNFHI